ncbi:hypothetical protein [Nesterenkonia pannonica]|uniref:hypothetical protein n=1 Tax=Nesterenkonia pannonica TaxID=1548602 RepID=UPI002164D983|nr:hypothetical protein [Nesterenkonia pannonica]
MVKTTTTVDVASLPQRSARSADSHREYGGKPALSRAEIGRRAAALLEDRSIINLGAGLPNQVVNYLNGRDVVLHAENGMLNYGDSPISRGRTRIFTMPEGTSSMFCPA